MANLLSLLYNRTFLFCLDSLESAAWKLNGYRNGIGIFMDRLLVCPINTIVYFWFNYVWNDP